MSSILALSHTFVEIDHEIIFTVILMRKYVQEGSDFVTCTSCILIKNGVLDSWKFSCLNKNCFFVKDLQIHHNFDFD